MKPYDPNTRGLRRNSGSDLPNEQGQSTETAIRVSAAPVLTQRHQAHESHSQKYFISAPKTARSFTVICGVVGENTNILGSDIRRRGLFVQNLGANSVFFSVGSQAGFDGVNFSGAMEIPVGASYEFPADQAPTNDVYIVATTNEPVFLMESVISI